MLFLIQNKILLAMAGMRFISSMIEFTAASLMLHFGTVETAFKINTVLAAVGPVIMIIVTSLGLIGLAGKIPVLKMLGIIAGVALIFISMR